MKNKTNMRQISQISYLARMMLSILTDSIPPDISKKIEKNAPCSELCEAIKRYAEGIVQLFERLGAPAKLIEGLAILVKALGYHIDTLTEKKKKEIKSLISEIVSEIEGYLD